MGLNPDNRNAFFTFVCPTGRWTSNTADHDGGKRAGSTTLALSPVVRGGTHYPYVLWGSLPHRRSVILSGEWQYKTGSVDMC